MGSKEQDFDWLRVVAEKLYEDGQQGLPEPARLRALATDAGQREIIEGLLRAFTPIVVPADRWQDWFDGGSSPRKAVSLVQFAAGPNSGKRKVADAAGVYEQACERAAKAEARVGEVRRTLAAAEAEFAIAEQAKVKAAAMAQGAALWLLLREFSRRVDAIYARGPAASLIDSLCCGLSLQEAQAGLKAADEIPDDRIEELDLETFQRAKKALRVYKALEELEHSPGLASKLRQVVVEACEQSAAERSASKGFEPANS